MRMTTQETNGEDDILLAYANDYGVGNYTFGQAGGDSGCSLSWYYSDDANPDNRIMWKYTCEQGPVFENNLFHQQSCLGYGSDFDNFACLFSVNSYNAVDQQHRTLLQFTMACKHNEGCVCNGDIISPTSCEICSTCPAFRPSHIADFIHNESIMPTMEFECGAKSLEDDETFRMTQACPMDLDSPAPPDELPVIETPHRSPPRDISDPSKDFPSPSSTSSGSDSHHIWTSAGVIAILVATIAALIGAIAYSQKQDKKKSNSPKMIPKSVIKTFSYEDPDLEPINLSPKVDDDGEKLYEL